MSHRILAGCVICSITICVLPAAPWASAQAKPDLRVTELLAERVTSAGVPLKVKVTLGIKNFGATTPSGFTTRLTYKTKGSAPYHTLYDFHSGVRAMNGGDRWERVFDFQEGGTYYFKADADVDKQIAEFAEGNNTRTLFKTFPAGTPDLALANLNAQFTSVTSSIARVRVEWDVENIGDGKAAGSFVAVLKVSKNGASFAELARFPRSNLDAGKRFHYIKEATYSDVRSLRFMVYVDATHTIRERNENNNAGYTQTIRP